MQTLPPYVSWSSFVRTLDMLGGLVLDQLDFSSIPGLSVSLASQMAQAFRFLGLVKPDGSPTQELRMLANSPESRPAVLAKVFRQSYPEFFGQVIRPLSEKALEELMARTGLSPATQRKAVTFALNAASYMDIRVDLNTLKVATPATGVVQESQSVTGPTRNSLTVPLASGGSVGITVDVDVMQLDSTDREFVFGLIDKVRAYQGDRQRQKMRDLDLREDEQVILRGDEEVPF